MQTHSGQNINSYSDVIEDTLTDGVHLHVTTGRKLLQTVLAKLKLHMTRDIQQSDISPAYIAVQKHLPAAKGGGALCAGNAVALLVFGPVMP